jgi:DNA uptake protein ComE-like DNA-binding protein
MMTVRVLAGALIATSLSTLTGAALAQPATDAGANTSRSVRVVYPGPYGTGTSTPVQAIPSTAQPTAAANTSVEPPLTVTQPETVEPSASPALSAAHTSPATPRPLRPSSPAEQPVAAEPVGLTASDPERVDINAASAEDLNRLGGRFAKAIIASRPYGSVDELVSKRALTRSTFSQIKDRITAN